MMCHRASSLFPLTEIYVSIMAPPNLFPLSFPTELLIWRIYSMSVWSVLLLHSPVLSRWLHPVHQPGEILRFIYSAVLSVSLSPFTHALLNCSAHQFEAADPERLQHFSHLLQPSELQQPDRTFCERLRIQRLIDETGLMRGGQHEYMEILVSAYPWGFSCDGRLCECLWLQAWVVCQRGGSVSMHLPLHCHAVMTAH